MMMGAAPGMLLCLRAPARAPNFEARAVQGPLVQAHKAPMRRLASSPLRGGVSRPRLACGARGGSTAATAPHPFGDGELPRNFAPPSAAEVAAHHAHIERQGTAQRAKELLRLQSMSSEVSREQDTLYTFSRTMAHALLVRPVLFTGDAVNPATLWGATYDDVGGPEGALAFKSASAVEPGKALPGSSEEALLNVITPSGPPTSS
jgi:hypothetical protein